MAPPYREWVRGSLLGRVEAPLIRVLVALHITPNAVTMGGFLLAAGAACLVGAGMLLAGGVVFFVASLMDMMDGTLARATGQQSRAGALLDSTMDRLGEAALLLGLSVYGVLSDMGEGRLLAFIVLIILALVSSQMVSYLRARGEGLGIETKVGLMTRSERVVLLSVGVVLAGLGVDFAMESVLGIIAALSTYTMLQRLAHVWRQVKG